MPANDDERDLEWVDVTPELAHEWLGRNTHNRNLRSRTVSAYASDMANGVWRQTGDGIRFSRDGVLLDGQHRLAAVVESGATIRTVVVRGLDVAVQNDMDSGIIRKFADVLALQTETNTANLAAIVRAVTVWEAGFRLQTNYQPTRSQLFATLSEYPWLRDVARDSSAASRGSPGSANGSSSSRSLRIFWSSVSMWVFRMSTRSRGGKAFMASSASPRIMIRSNRPLLLVAR